MWTGSGGKRLQEKLKRSRKKKATAKTSSNDQHRNKSRSWIDKFRYTSPNAHPNAENIQPESHCFESMQPGYMNHAREMNSVSIGGTIPLTNIANDRRFSTCGNQIHKGYSKQAIGTTEFRRSTPSRQSNLRYESSNLSHTKYSAIDEENLHDTHLASDAVELPLMSESVKVVHSPMVSRGFFPVHPKIQSSSIGSASDLSDSTTQIHSMDSPLHSEHLIQQKYLRQVLISLRSKTENAMIVDQQTLINIIQTCCDHGSELAIQVLCNLAESTIVPWTENLVQLAIESITATFPSEMRIVQEYQILLSKLLN